MPAARAKRVIFVACVMVVIPWSATTEYKEFPASSDSGSVRGTGTAMPCPYKGLRRPSRVGRVEAEFGSEGFDLLTGFVEEAGAVDAFGGVAEFFFNRHLRSDARAGFGFGKAASDEALELLFGFAPGDDEAVKAPVKVGFDE